jgi:regulator of protease activity HflC (stomatin/prohibitin superfamily)
MRTKRGINPFHPFANIPSYGVEDAEYAVSQLAQTTMRSEIGQLTLDHVLKERQNLNANITEAINDAAQDWVF